MLRSTSVTTRGAKRDKYLRRKYGLTQAQYLLMVRAQEGKCAICHRKPKKGQRLHVDHDHKTDRVRGALCWFCNHKFLGRRRENPDHHEAAAVYLRSTFDWRSVLPNAKGLAPLLVHDMPSVRETHQGLRVGSGMPSTQTTQTPKCDT